MKPESFDLSGQQVGVPALPIIVATILPAAGPTGVHTHFTEFLRYLGTRGADATLVTAFMIRWLDLPSRALRKALSAAFPAVGVWWRSAIDARLLGATLRQRLRDGQPAIVYAQCPLSADAAMRVRCSPSQRVVLVVHFNESQAAEWERAGFIRRDGPLWRSTLDRESRVLSSVDGIVYVSDFMRREVEQRVPGAARVAKALIPNFVQAPPASETGTLPATELVSIGTLEPRKNQGYALEVLAELHRQGWPVALTLIGAGPDHDALTARVQALGLTGHVRFAGYVAGASSQLSRFKAYLHVARMENFPLVLVEAMARGLPVFAPDTGGTAEAFTHGVEGWVIPLDDAAQAARVVGVQLADATDLQRAAQAARLRFTEHYETSRLAARLFDFLQSRRADASRAA